MTYVLLAVLAANLLVTLRSSLTWHRISGEDATRMLPRAWR